MINIIRKIESNFYFVVMMCLFGGFCAGKIITNTKESNYRNDNITLAYIDIRRLNTEIVKTDK